MAIHKRSGARRPVMRDADDVGEHEFRGPGPIDEETGEGEPMPGRPVDGALPPGEIPIRRATLREPEHLRAAREKRQRREAMLNRAVDQGAKDMDDAIARRRK